VPNYIKPLVTPGVLSFYDRNYFYAVDKPHSLKTPVV